MINEEVLRELAALVAYPKTGEYTWSPTKPFITTKAKVDPKPPRFTVEFCATKLGVEPYTGRDWRTQAACHGTDTELFYPEQGAPIADARRVCNGCPVRAECLADALNRNDRYGVWGGMNERQRRGLRAMGPPRIPAEIPHGTVLGYGRHRRAGEKPCTDCNRAFWRRSRELEKARRGESSEYTRGDNT